MHIQRNGICINIKKRFLYQAISFNFEFVRSDRTVLNKKKELFLAYFKLF